MDQIPLPFSVNRNRDFASFLRADNGPAVAALQQAAAGGVGGNIYLWGRPGSGKSHLLQASCTLASDSDRTVAYLPLRQADELEPEILEGLEQVDLVCVDDLDRIAGLSPWEQALFHLFNRVRDHRGCLIFTAASSPRAVGIELADLKSRLAWDLCFHLQALDTESLVTAVRTRARERMFDVTDEVMEYILSRVARDAHSLFGLLDELDKATLSAQRKLTIPLVRELLDREKGVGTA